MGTLAIIAEEVYLATNYRPDCDYIEGVLEERSAGQKDHSVVQDELLAWFRERRAALGMRALPEQRIKVGRGRYRIPDVCVVRLPLPEEQVFTEPPYICIEVLSPEDSFPRLQDRFDDYLKLGVGNVWVIDPAARHAWSVSVKGHLEALDGVLRTTDEFIALPWGFV